MDYTAPVVSNVGVVGAAARAGVEYLGANATVGIQWFAADEESGIAPDVQLCVHWSSESSSAGSTCTVVPSMYSTATLSSLSSLWRGGAAATPTGQLPKYVTLEVIVTNGVGLTANATSVFTYVIVWVAPVVTALYATYDAVAAVPTTCSRHAGYLSLAWTLQDAAVTYPVRYDVWLTYAANSSVAVAVKSVAVPDGSTTLLLVDAGIADGRVLRPCLQVTDVVGQVTSLCANSTGTVTIDTHLPTGGAAAVAQTGGTSHVAIWSPTTLPQLAVVWRAGNASHCPLATATVSFVDLLSSVVVVSSDLLTMNATGSYAWPVNDTIIALLPSGESLRADIVVTTTSGASATLSTPSFVIDVVPPECLNCSSVLTVTYPPLLYRQSGFPNNASNCTVTVTVYGVFDDLAVVTALWTLNNATAASSGGVSIATSSGTSVVSVVQGALPTQYTFTVAGVTVSHGALLAVSAVLVAVSGLQSTIVSSPPYAIDLQEVLPGAVTNNGGTGGCGNGSVVSAHVDVQSGLDGVTACWTHFLNLAAHNADVVDCTWGLRFAADSDFFTVAGPFHVQCAALTASIPGVDVPFGSLVIDVASVGAGLSYPSSSPPFTVAAPPFVIAATPLVSGERSMSLCRDFTVDGNAVAVPVAVLAGTGPCGSQYNVSGVEYFTVNNSTVRACFTVAATPPVVVFIGLQVCDLWGRCARSCDHAVAFDVTPPRVDQATVWPDLSHRTAVTSNDNFGCNWQLFYDADSGIDHYSVCVSSRFLRPCDVTVVGVTVPATMTRAVVTTHAAAGYSRYVYCVVTAVDRAGNNATQWSDAIPVYDVAIDALSVSIVSLASLDSSAQANNSQLTAWRFTQVCLSSRRAASPAVSHSHASVLWCLWYLLLFLLLWLWW